MLSFKGEREGILDLLSRMKFANTSEASADLTKPSPSNPNLSLYSVIDHYATNSKNYQKDAILFDKLFFFYYDAGRKALKEGNGELKREIIKTIEQLVSAHESYYRKSFDDYVINMKKIIQALEEENRKYFELPIEVEENNLDSNGTL
jgi:hypothetical protein